MNQTDGFREMEIYKMACTRLRPDQHAVNKVMQRKRAPEGGPEKGSGSCGGLHWNVCLLDRRHSGGQTVSGWNFLQTGNSDWSRTGEKGDQYVIHMEEGTRTKQKNDRSRETWRVCGTA